MSGNPEVFDPYLQWLGIDAAARPVNHYSLLGLPLFEADLGRISAAADQRMGLIRKYQAGPRGIYTQQLLNELARAKICLLNPVSKPAYDQALHQILYPPPVMPSATAAPPKPRRKLEDIMPPGWDSSSLPVPAAQPSPQRIPPTQERPAARALPERGSGKKSQPIALFAAIGGLIVLIGVFGTLLVISLKFTEVPGDFEVQMPQQPDTRADVDPAPVEEPASEAIVVLQEGSGELNLTPATALVEGDIVREVLGTTEVLAKWSGADDAAEWQFKLVKPGFFEVELQYISHPSLTGKLVKIGWDGESKAIPLRHSAGEMPEVRDSHILLIKRGGEHTFTFRPAEAWPADTLKLVSIRLIPAVGP